MRQVSKPSSSRFFDINGWAFVSVAMGLISVFMLYPIAKSLWMSVQSGQGTMTKFVGLGNVERLLDDPMFLRALTNTSIFLVVQVPIMIVLALVMASCLNIPNLKGRSLLRTAVFLPCVTSLVAYSVLFKSMFSYDGLVNSTLMELGIISESVPWLTDPFWARVVVILAITWRWTGYNMVFYLAALQNIDRSIYEAARIDGVPPWARFTQITIPLLKPVILFTTVTSTIGTLQLFDEPYVLTNGGPNNATLTVGMYLYQNGFKYFDFGYASAIAYALTLVIVVLGALQMRVMGDRDK